MYGIVFKLFIPILAKFKDFFLTLIDFLLTSMEIDRKSSLMDKLWEILQNFYIHIVHFTAFFIVIVVNYVEIVN